MADFLIQATLSNLVVATILALVAWIVQHRVRSASLANLLWALVLIKMITPPLFSLPVVEVPTVSSVSRQTVDVSTELPPGRTVDTAFVAEVSLSGATAPPTNDAFPQTTASGLWRHIPRLAIYPWIVVSAILLVISAVRILRFHWLLKVNLRVHEELSSGLCANVARQLGVRSYPDIVVSSANIAPFVWWLGGRSIIVVSEQAIQQLSDEDLRFVIAHEMAHIKRRDHWFRWLEWTALIGLWWNPVMWWARTQLRVCEEIACDDLVLEMTNREIHPYANSLLNVAELLTSSAIRPPVVASAINSGGNLEKRLKMMIAEKTSEVPSWVRALVCAVAICVFPIGLVYAQDFEAVERRLGGAVKAGELSLEQANVMMEALKRSAGSQHENGREMEVRKRRYMAFAKEIKAAVKAGKLSKEDAEKKMNALRQQMFGAAGDKKEARSDSDRDRDIEARNQRYMAFGKEIAAAVKAGELSKEEAEKKLIMMFRGAGAQKEAQSDRDRDMEVRKRRYMALAKQIESAVKTGRLSKEDAEKKLIAVRQVMFGEAGEKKGTRSDRDQDREMEARKRRYMAFAKEIEAAVKAGKLSKEDAEKKLIEMRREMFEDKSGDERSDREMEGRRRRYEQVTRRIKAAIESGGMSAEEGEEKLIEIRKEIFGGEK